MMVPYNGIPSGRISSIEVVGFPKGANANVLFNTEPMDPISGSLQLRVYPCNIKKLVELVRVFLLCTETQAIFPCLLAEEVAYDVVLL